MSIAFDRQTKDLLTDDPTVDGRAAMIIFGLFVFGFLGWSTFAPMDAGVVGHGVIKVSGNRQTIQHRDGGVISSVSVREGDRVAAGQILLNLAANEITAEERSLTGQIFELEAMLARLEAEREGRALRAPEAWAALPPERLSWADDVLKRQREEQMIRAAALNAQIAVLRSRKSELNARIQGPADEIVALDSQKRLIGDELVALKSLEAEGFAAATRVRSVERAQADIEGRRAERSGALAQARESTAETDLQVLSVQKDRREAIAREISAAETKLADLRPRAASVRAQLARAEVRAPLSGQVVGLGQFNPGAVVRPGERILDIVPDQRDLVVEAKIKPQDSDDVRPGSAADVRFTSFGSRGQSRVHGVVKRISADRMVDERTGAEYFTIEISVSREELARLSSERQEKDLGLRAGLPAEVMLPLRSRTALQYLLEPLDQAIWGSFREH
jgi:HlyD family secretion protein